MARSGFAGFPPEAMEFLRGLARNNRREWFLPRKAVYETSVKQPMRELVTALNQALAGFAPEYATDPEKAIFRIYRDVRFSKDKKPYKEHIAASALLSSYHSVSHSAYMKLLSDLRAIRAECNEDMLAILAHHKKMLGLPTLH